jgi:nucleoside-diphosphate-sugar epimerase
VIFETAVEGADHKQIFWDYLIGYRNSAWLLTLICLVVFFLSGFYTYGRAYQGRYKALVVAHGVSLGFSLFGFLSYFTDWVGLRRGTLLYAWILSVGMLIVARVWASLWSTVVRAENRKVELPADQRIQNVLVIGGAGYIGSALLPMLLERGYRVRLLDLFLYGSDAIKDVLSHPGLELMRADFRQIDKVVQAMHNMDAVIHLGAIVGDPACAIDEDLTLEVNLMATRMIAEVAKGSGVGRFIFASTCSVYGASDQVLDEHSTLNPVSLYAKSKIASEQVLMSMADARFAPTILRFGTIYGLSGRTRFDLVVNLLTAKAYKEGQITLLGGDQWRPFLHVHDAARAVFLTLESRLALVRDQVFNVGSNEQNYTIGQVGGIIGEIVPQAFLMNLGSDTDRRNYRVNFNKIRDTLGFAPEWSVEQGVRQVIEAFETGRVQDYRDAKYSNVKFLTDEGAYLLVRQNGWAHELIRESSALPLAAAAAGD